MLVPQSPWPFQTASALATFPSAGRSRQEGTFLPGQAAHDCPAPPHPTGEGWR